MFRNELISINSINKIKWIVAIIKKQLLKRWLEVFINKFRKLWYILLIQSRINCEIMILLFLYILILSMKIDYIKKLCYSIHKIPLWTNELLNFPRINIEFWEESTENWEPSIVNMCNIFQKPLKLLIWIFISL